MLPNLIIIGAMKSATTSLHYYLNCHPHVVMSQMKELDFFIASKNWNRGLEWYESNFKGRANIFGEASPNYTNHPFVSGVPERMSSVIPGAKLIYVVRDPLERIISHYVHNYADGREHRTLADALKDLHHNRYVTRSLYYLQLQQYLNYFPAENILIITRESLDQEREPTLRQVFRFLGVEKSFYCRQFAAVRHRSDGKRRKNKFGQRLSETALRSLSHLRPAWRWHVEKLIYYPLSNKIRRPVLDDELRARLIDYLQEDINELRRLTKYSFAEWSL